MLEIAKLGGWRQSHGALGVKVIWRGLYALQFLTMGFSLAFSQKNMRKISLAKEEGQQTSTRWISRWRSG